MPDTDTDAPVHVFRPDVSGWLLSGSRLVGLALFCALLVFHFVLQWSFHILFWFSFLVLFLLYDITLPLLGFFRKSGLVDLCLDQTGVCLTLRDGTTRMMQWADVRSGKALAQNHWALTDTGWQTLDVHLLCFSSSQVDEIGLLFRDCLARHDVMIFGPEQAPAQVNEPPAPEVLCLLRFLYWRGWYWRAFYMTCGAFLFFFGSLLPLLLIYCVLEALALSNAAALGGLYFMLLLCSPVLALYCFGRLQDTWMKRNLCVDPGNRRGRHGIYIGLMCSVPLWIVALYGLFAFRLGLAGLFLLLFMLFVTVFFGYLGMLRYRLPKRTVPPLPPLCRE